MYIYLYSVIFLQQEYDERKEWYKINTTITVKECVVYVLIYLSIYSFFLSTNTVGTVLIRGYICTIKRRRRGVGVRKLE